MNKKYQVTEFLKEEQDYGEKEIVIKDNTIRDVLCRSYEDAHRLAQIAGFFYYEVREFEVKADGYCSERDSKRVFVSPQILEWEAIVEKQKKAKADRKTKVIETLNALPLKITLYKDKDFIITATRDNANAESYRGLDVQYNSEIYFKGDTVGWGLTTFITDGRYETSGPKHKLLKKRFAQEIFERTDKGKKLYAKQSWDQWKETKKNIATELVEEYGAILETAVNKLNEYKDKICQIKMKL